MVAFNSFVNYSVQRPCLDGNIFTYHKDLLFVFDLEIIYTWEREAAPQPPVRLQPSPQHLELDERVDQLVLEVLDYSAATTHGIRPAHVGFVDDGSHAHVASRRRNLREYSLHTLDAE